jgi:hypothetical protein
MVLESSIELPATRCLGRMWLVRGHPVYLTLAGVRGENELACAFRLAWRYLPSAARRRILEYWRDPGSAVQVVSDMPPNQTGEVTRYGHTVQFLGSACADMPTPACIGLVQHELAHVYHFASFEEDHHTVVDVTGKVAERCEWLVEDTINEWGLEQFKYELIDWEAGQT